MPSSSSSPPAPSVCGTPGTSQELSSSCQSGPVKRNRMPTPCMVLSQHRTSSHIGLEKFDLCELLATRCGFQIEFVHVIWNRKLRVRTIWISLSPLFFAENHCIWNPSLSQFQEEMRSAQLNCHCSLKILMKVPKRGSWKFCGDCHPKSRAYKGFNLLWPNTVARVLLKGCQ